MLTHPDRFEYPWYIIALLVFPISLYSAFNFEIYNDLLLAKVFAGTLAQDVMSIFVSITMLVILLTQDISSSKIQIVMTGLVGYTFYAYGIYVIEQVYTEFYFAYMFIFAMALYTLIGSLIDFNQDLKVEMSQNFQRLSTVMLFLIPAIFYPLWVSSIIPLIAGSHQLDNLYSIYIIDLCIIMPAFLICGYLTYKHNSTGYLLGPSLMLIGFSILLPVAFGELFKPIFLQDPDIFGLLGFGVLSIFFLVISVLQLREIEIIS